ncbi:MAG: right-handed parallel beta-helix repeat-containing protein [Pirellulales bacterium]|nr:right-handed parallel beta-helix repeat-containing protein [Pirellulales bacterium]
MNERRALFALLTLWMAVTTTLTVTPAVAAAGAATPGLVPAWFPKAPPLPEPAGQVIRVSTVEELFRAAEDVQPGGTILVADGHYLMSRYFELHTDRVTLRGESGDREKVVLDGARSRHHELVGITACSGVTVADLTIQNIPCNGLKLNSDRGVQKVTVYNCVIHNIWQRGIKGVRVPRDNAVVRPPADCRVQYCLFYNDRPKQYSDDGADTPQNFGGNYIGGMDIMYAVRWTISDNVFVGIHGRTGAARGAIFLWHDTEDCLIERNLIIDCDSGICLGNSYRGPETETHCRRCLVRDNFLTRCSENGILADYTRECKIVHNTIHDPESRLKRLIRLVHDNDGLLVANNLLSGPPMRIETDSPMQIRGNVTRDPTFADALVDAARGDLHLKAAVTGVVDAAEPLPEAKTDIDRQPRDATPDVGADEFVPR